jgi:hypothetical protein
MAHPVHPEISVVLGEYILKRSGGNDMVLCGSLKVPPVRYTQLVCSNRMLHIEQPSTRDISYHL